MQDRISTAIISFLSDELEIEGVELNTKLENLDMDSLVLVEVGMIVEQKFGVYLRDDELATLTTVQSLVDVCYDKFLKKNAA